MYSTKTMLDLLTSWKIGTMSLDELREMEQRFARAGLNVPMEKAPKTTELETEIARLTTYSAQCLKDREEMRQELLRTRSELSAARTNLGLREAEVLSAQDDLSETTKMFRDARRELRRHSQFRERLCEILEITEACDDSYLLDRVKGLVTL